AFGTKTRSSGSAPTYAPTAARASASSSLEPPCEEQDRLALELELPFLIALEHAARAGSERAVVQKGHTWVEEKLDPEVGAVRHRSYGSRACLRASGRSVRARTGRRAPWQKRSASARSRQACSSGAATATPKRRGPFWPVSSRCTTPSCSETWMRRSSAS